MKLRNTEIDNRIGSPKEILEDQEELKNILSSLKKHGDNGKLIDVEELKKHDALAVASATIKGYLRLGYNGFYITDEGKNALSQLEAGVDN
jgi:hypothetical protein